MIVRLRLLGLRDFSGPSKKQIQQNNQMSNSEERRRRKKKENMVIINTIYWILTNVLGWVRG
jgi:hypothetical protein